MNQSDMVLHGVPLHQGLYSEVLPTQTSGRIGFTQADKQNKLFFILAM